MADNYLEKRMEDYHSHPPRLARKTEPQRAAFVRYGLSEEGRRKVAELRASGEWRVAFCGLDYKAGNRLAQATGARFYPCDPADEAAVARALADLSRRWHLTPTLFSEK